MRNRIRKVHFVGIGGVGMCGIAEVLHNLQYKVSGSDIAESVNTRRLKELGITIHIGHKAEQVADMDVVVISSAVDETNPEVAFALQNNIPVIPRAEMLGELMRFQEGIAIAGTHGKTTTTSLVASVLAEGGLDPTFVIGGRLNSANSNARLGKGQYLVAEADESDASFLHLFPVIAVVTNIDADHMSTYGGDFERLKSTFIDFLHNLPFYGLAILCIDDPVVREVLPRVHKPVLTYGFSEDADVRITNMSQKGIDMRFDVAVEGDPEWMQVSIHHPGRHNALNALAAVCVARTLEVNREDIQRGLDRFQGIARRFQVNARIGKGEKEIIFIDDYAHHPTELLATIDAVQKGWPDKRLLVVFQPHRYSRTHELLDDFSAALSGLQQLVVTEIYPAGERPIAGADGRSLCRAIRARGRIDPVFVEDINDLGAVVKDLVQPGDVVLTMGAGNIGQVAIELVQQFQGQDK